MTSPAVDFCRGFQRYRGKIVKMLSQVPTTKPTTPDIPVRTQLLTNKQAEVENCPGLSIGKDRVIRWQRDLVGGKTK